MKMDPQGKNITESGSKILMEQSSSTRDKLDIAFNLLSYNQGLVQFADGKANALLLINSIFIASLGPFIETMKSSNRQFTSVIFILFFLTSILSILFSLTVILSRKATYVEDERPSVIYYGHIAERPTSISFINEFKKEKAESILDATLANVFIISQIAQTKFSLYNTGQTLTLISAVLWIFCIALAFLS